MKFLPSFIDTTFNVYKEKEKKERQEAIKIAICFIQYVTISSSLSVIK